MTALRGDSVPLETVNPSSPGQDLDPSRFPLSRGPGTPSLCRGRDGKISPACRQIALCKMWGFYAAARHVWKVGGCKETRTCSHCTAALTCFDNKDRVTGLSVFLKCTSLYCWWRLLCRENRNSNGVVFLAVVAWLLKDKSCPNRNVGFVMKMWERHVDRVVGKLDPRGKC